MEIRVSVRALVEFLTREGDIDERRAKVPENAMQEGGRLHRRIQKAQGADYAAEVPLSFTFDAETYVIVIEGRADGILRTYAKEAADEPEGTAAAKQLSGAGAGDSADAGNSAGAGDGDRRVPRVMVDEIKGTFRELDKLKEPVTAHLAQAKCYAFMLAEKESLSEIDVRLTYGHLESGDLKYFHFHYTYQEIHAWFAELMRTCRKWTDLQVAWEETRTASIKALQFPFAYRNGQRELAAGVYRTIVHGKKLFLEAPTGTGKTLATLFPAVKAIGEGKAERLFYLTAKTIARTAPEEAFRLMAERGGLRFRTVTLTAKEKICPMCGGRAAGGETAPGKAENATRPAYGEQPVQEKPVCNPEACPFAKGHFDRVGEALYDLLTSAESFDREQILRFADAHRVCPFEFALDLTLFADGIICDYNYLFDPFVFLRRFFDAQTKGRHIFLVDEAHNLVDRGRNMYSALLTKEELHALHRAVRETKDRRLTGTGKALRRVDRCFEELRTEARMEREASRAQGDDGAARGGAKDVCVYLAIGELAGALSALQDALSAYLEEQGELPLREELTSAFFETARFLTIYEHFLLDTGHRYVIYGEEQAGGRAGAPDGAYANGYAGKEDGALTGTEGEYRRRRFSIRIFCMDPSGELAACMAKGVSSILFSATLLPIQYYKRLLGGTAEDFEIYAESVFDQSRCARGIVRDVTTRYRARDARQYRRVAQCIHAAITSRQGNYLVFFPSYAFLSRVRQVYQELYYDADAQELLVQEPGMGEAAREHFLGRFTERETAVPEGVICMEIEEIPDRSKIGFCVMGGIFGEGIDLRADALIGVIVVGTGLPQVAAESELLRSHFDAAGMDGFDYAYRFPGMNRVLQAAGRVIRTQTDIGFVLLLDDRFADYSYRSLFPREWNGRETVMTEQVSDFLRAFWSKWEKQ